MPRKNLTDKIILNQIYNARYVRLYIDIHTSNDPDGGIEYNTVSIYELEVYGGNLDEKMSMSDVLNEFQVQTPNVGDKKLNVTLPEVEGYTVEYNGTDFGQVIDKDLTIYQPISDKKVKVSFKTTDTNDYKFKEVTVTVPGSEKMMKHRIKHKYFTRISQMVDMANTQYLKIQKFSIKIVHFKEPLKLLQKIMKILNLLL